MTEGGTGGRAQPGPGRGRRGAGALACLGLLCGGLGGCAVVNLPGEVVVVRPAQGSGRADEAGSSQVLVHGSFAGRRSLIGPAATMGGGCLLYRWTDRPDSCQFDADCAVRRGGAASQGYCQAEGSPTVGDAADGICWFKAEPDRDACVRGQNVSGGTFRLGPVPAYPGRRGDAVAWRVLSCQDLVERGCANPLGVQGVDRIYRYGPVTLLPAREGAR